MASFGLATFERRTVLWRSGIGIALGIVGIAGMGNTVMGIIGTGTDTIRKKLYIVPLSKITRFLPAKMCDMIVLPKRTTIIDPKGPSVPTSSTLGRKFPAEILSPEEVRQLLYAPNDRYPTGLRNRALIATLYGAGLRIQEALDLRPTDIDVEERSIRILHGKNDKARFAGIDQGALLHVVRWIDARRARGTRGKTLFCTLAGAPLNQRYVRAMLGRMATRAGIDKRVHPHGLRHTHATELERAGFTVTEIQQQLGHTHLNTTAIYLNHISPSARISKIGERRSVL